MRILLGVLVLMASCFSSFAKEEASPEQVMVKALQKHVKLGSVNVKSERDDEKQKFEVIATQSKQDEDDPFIGTMRFTFEMTDKEGVVYFGQGKASQKAHDREYAGADDWQFKISHGDLKFPKLTAYALEYGYESNGTFVVVQQSVKKAESGDEIMARNKDEKLKIKTSAVLKKVYRKNDVSGSSE